MHMTAEALARRAEKEREKRAAETPEQREARLAKRRARYSSAEWREKHRADCRVYYQANREKFAEYERRKRAQPKARDAELIRARRRHGITEATAERRNGMCAVAGCEYVGPLVLDHWHDGPRKGEWRGWICSNCNTGIGLLQDSARKLRAAAEYLELAAGVGWPDEKPLDADPPAD